MSNYLRKLHENEKEITGQMEPGKVYRLEVQHDEWCRLLNGRGDCNCDPIIVPPEEVSDERTR
jgi:hypothetical protein